MSRQSFMPRQLQTIPTTPFDSAEEAWLWYAQCQLARLAGCRPRPDLAAIARPCDPDDIYRAAMGLARAGTLRPDHLRVLAEMGVRLTQADHTTPVAAPRATLWQEALDRLETVLKNKGIVA